MDLRDSFHMTEQWMVAQAGNVTKIKDLVKEVCSQGFEPNTKLLVKAFLQNFRRRTQEVLQAATVAIND